MFHLQTTELEMVVQCATSKGNTHTHTHTHPHAQAHARKTGIKETRSAYTHTRAHKTTMGIALVSKGSKIQAQAASPEEFAAEA